MNKGIYGIIAVLFIWLCIITSHMASNSKDIEDSNTEISKIVKKLVEKPKRQIKVSADFKKTYFKQEFFKQRKMYGAGHIFTWHGNEYTTDYKEEK